MRGMRPKQGLGGHASGRGSERLPAVWSQGLNEGLRGKRLADDKGYMRSLVLISLRLESDSSDPPLLKLYQVVRLLEKDAVCSAEVFQYHPSPFCGILFLEASFLICEECIKALRTVPAYSKHLINHPSPLYLTYGIHKDSCGKRFFFFFSHLSILIGISVKILWLLTTEIHFGYVIPRERGREEERKWEKER